MKQITLILISVFLSIGIKAQRTVNCNNNPLFLSKHEAASWLTESDNQSTQKNVTNISSKNKMESGENSPKVQDPYSPVDPAFKNNQESIKKESKPTNADQNTLKLRGNILKTNNSKPIIKMVN